MPTMTVGLAFRGAVKTLPAQFYQRPPEMWALVTMNRAQLEDAVDETAARFGYVEVGVNEKAIFQMYSVQLAQANGWVLNGWLAFPSTYKSFDVEMIKLKLYPKLEDVVMPPGQRFRFQRWASEILAFYVEKKMKQALVFAASVGEGEYAKDPEHLLAWQAGAVEGYLEHYGLPIKPYVRELEVPGANLFGLPCGGEQMMVYTLPDGSTFTAKPSGGVWEGPMTNR